MRALAWLAGIVLALALLALVRQDRYDGCRRGEFVQHGQSNRAWWRCE